MIKKLKDRHIVAFALVILTGMLSLKYFDSTSYPKSVEELSKTSVMIYSNSGSGSGVILSSNKKRSLILTNAHVCSMFVSESPTVSTEDDKKLSVVNYKLYDKHDLCLVKVKENLGISIKVSNTSLLKYDIIRVAGHPLGLPTIVSIGNFSGDYTSIIYEGHVPCTQDPKELDDSELLSCILTGKMPVFSEYKGKVLSIIIAGGSSGSGVFNEKGELCGLIFAARADRGTMGFAASVPLESIRDFLENQDKYEWEL